MRAAQEGSAEALETLFRWHWPRAYRAAYLVVHDAAAAEDLAQESFLAAVRGLDRFDRSRPFGPWLHRIVVNRAIDFARARALKSEAGALEAISPAASADSPGRPYSEELMAALAGLSPEHRAVVVLRYLLEFTPGEIAVGAAALTPPGEAVGEWISEAVRPARPPARPALTSLPTGGRLLVTSRQGPWVVQPDGSKRRLGRYSEAAWSPGGLFVVATRGRQLVALEPGGAVRWTLARSAPVSDPAWSPDGFRIAYLSGSSVRVVAGDGTGDAALAGGVAPVTPAWRPAAEHVLAYVDKLGTIVVRDSDTGGTLWRSRTSEFPTRLLWSPDGSYLVVISRERVAVFDREGAPRTDRPLPAGARTGTASVNPATGTLALVRYRPGLDRSEVVTLPLETGGGPSRSRPRRLFSGDGRFGDLAWSPDGTWLLLAWREANQWLFIRSARVNKLQAVSNIGRQFDPGGGGASPFPRVSGWCCARPPDSLAP